MRRKLGSHHRPLVLGRLGTCAGSGTDVPRGRCQGSMNGTHLQVGTIACRCPRRYVVAAKGLDAEEARMPKNSIPVSGCQCSPFALLTEVAIHVVHTQMPHLLRCCRTTQSSGPPFWKEIRVGLASVFWPPTFFKVGTDLERASLDAKFSGLWALSVESFCLRPSSFS